MGMFTLKACFPSALTRQPQWTLETKFKFLICHCKLSAPPFPTPGTAPHLILCSLINSSTVTIFAGLLEDALEQTVDRRDVATEDRGSTEEKQIKGQSNEQIYGKVAVFLEQFKSLESAKEQLNCLEEDLKLKKETLEAAISKVEAAWKVSKSDG